jgi:hypothetical protein
MQGGIKCNAGVTFDENEAIAISRQILVATVWL